VFACRKDYKAMFFKSLKQARETKEGVELKKVNSEGVLVTNESCMKLYALGATAVERVD